MTFFFVTTAFAHTAQTDTSSTPSGGESILVNMLPMVLIMAVFYFLMIRPQSKKMKEHAKMLDNLQVGDKILMNSGIFGALVKVEAAVFVVRIADGVEIKVRRDAILSRAEENNETAATVKSESKAGGSAVSTNSSKASGKRTGGIAIKQQSKKGTVVKDK